jgi:hypothetical protein
MRAATLCEGTLGKNGPYGWNTLRICIPAADELARYRNASPAAHGKEKATRRGVALEPPSAEKLRTCLWELRKGLSETVMVNGRGLPDTWDAVLVDEHESLTTELRAFIGPV